MKLRNKLILLGILVGVISCLGMNNSQASEITSVFSGKTITRNTVQNVELASENNASLVPVTLGISKDRESENWYVWNPLTTALDEKGNLKVDDNNNVQAQKVWKIAQYSSVSSNTRDYSNLYYCLNAERGFGLSTNGMAEGAKDTYSAAFNMKDVSLKSTITNYAGGKLGKNYNKILWILDNSYIPTNNSNYQNSLEYKKLMGVAGIEIDGDGRLNLTEDDIEVVQQMAIWYFTTENYIDNNNAENNRTYNNDGNTNGKYKLPSLYLNGTQLSSIHFYTTEYGEEITAEYRQEKAEKLFDYFITNADSNYTVKTPTLTLSNSNVTVTEDGDNYIVGPFSLSGTNTDLIKEITATLNVNATLLNSSKKEVTDNAFSKVIGSNFYLKIAKNEISSNSTKITIKLTYTYDEKDLTFLTDANDSTNTQPVVLVKSTEKTANTETDTTIELTSVSVEKVWDDSNNQDGKRPNSVDVQLYKNNEKYGNKITLNSSNNWKYNWDKLLDGYTYTVKELDESGKKAVDDGKKYDENYTATYKISDNKTTITNTYVPESTEVSITKIWEDNNNQDGKRSEYGVTLKANGKPYGEEVILNKDTLTYTWTDLPKYENGNKITYTVEETTVPEGYNVEYSNGTFTITNKYTPEKTEVSITKKWEDNNNQDRKRDEYGVTLYKNGEPYGEEVKLEPDTLTYKWEDLPKYENGNEIIYTVKETTIPEGYTAKYSEDTFTITNEYTPDKTEVSITKKWEDNNNQDGKRSEYGVTLKANGETYGEEVILNKDTLTYTWTDLPKYENGNKITYTVEETTVPEGYKVTYSEDTFTITNTYTPEETEVSITKKWADNDNQDRKRDEYGVTLYQNGEPYGEEVKLEPDTLTYKWENLPKYENGDEITYTVKETTIPDEYKVTYSDDTFTITNTYTPGKTSKKVIKVWNDEDNQDGKRPRSVTVTLYKTIDGEKTKIESQILSESNNWTYVWSELDKKENGKDIIYSVEENEVANYTTAYSSENYQNTDEITITNTHTPEVITGKYNVLIRKVDENGNILTGAKFEINETEYDLKDGEKILLENEQLTSTDPVTKIYNIKETVVPEGYVQLEEVEIRINATVVKDEEAKAYKILRATGTFNEEERHENITVTLEGNTIVITVKNNPIQKKLDLALRKFITKINDVEYSRAPVVDTSKLGTSVDGKVVTTATYKHIKQPIAVQKGDVVTYTIRVYNEGEIDGYAEKITDHLPDNLLPIIEGIEGIDSEKYKNEIEFNSKYSWTYSDKGNTVTTMSTSKNNSEIYGMMTGLEDITDTKLDAYVEGSDKLDYIDVEIKCLVTDNAIRGEYLTNIAEITDAQDINEVHSDGSDSELANADCSNLSDYKNEEALKSTADSYVAGQEDDDDFEKLVVKEFDLSLKKFIRTDETSAIIDVAKRKEKIAKEEQEVKTVLERFKSDNLENNETVITKEYLTNEFENKIEFIKDTAPFSFKYVEGYGTTYIVTAEGELTVNNDNVKTEINNSEPIVDASKLGTKDSNGNIITNATYTYTKEPLIVETNDIITYTIRIYNEGTIAGYANEITDNIPEGLEFLPNSDVNVSYRWKMIDKDGNETEDVTKAVIITTDYLSDRDKNNIIAEVTETDGVKTLNYKDIEVQFKVIAKPEKLKDNIIKNEAQISADSDRDIDSTPNRDEKYDYNTGKNEDDIDYAPVKLQYFDLALRKFITKVNSINYNNRYPEVKFNDDGSFTYNHTKDPVLVETGDTVIYTIRVYNEGEKAGYATQIKDNLPEGLAFDPNNETNKLYGWKMIDKDGNETQEADKVVGFTTNYLEKELIDPLVEKNGSKVLSYKDVQIAFIVTETNVTDKILVNTAEISADSDDDVDSTPNNNIESEDDIDKEYVKVEYFDLSLKKWVTETIVTLDGKTTTTKTGFTPDSDGIAKVDIVASKVNKTTVKFKYSIKVTNEGEVPGYAYEIKDYIPSGLTFEQEDNENWTVLKNNTIVTTDQLKDTLLNPGESATVEIVLTWKNSSTNFGLKTNYAEISEDSGDDIDSTPDNYDFTEDDMDDAQILLSIKTARKTTYIGLILISITILAGGVYGIKKYVLK